MTLMPKRILVTGGAGFIGSAVAREIVRATPHEVVVLDKLTYAGNLDNLAPVATDPRFRFVRGDIIDTSKMREVVRSFRPDVIMHLAAESHVDRSIDGPAQFIQTNVVGTFSLLQAALELLARADAARRATLSASITSRPTRCSARSGADGPFTETTPYQPNSPYSASKAASDHLVRAWHHTYGLPVVAHELLEQLRALSFPRKADPADDPQRARRPSRCRSMARARTSATGSMWRTTRGRFSSSPSGAGRRELQRRRHTARRPTLRWSQAICALVDELAPNGGIGPREQLITFVDGPARARSALCHRRVPRCATSSAGCRGDLRERAAQDRAVVSRERAWWSRIRSGLYRGERLGIVA